MIILAYTVIRVIWFASTTTQAWNDTEEFRIISDYSPLSKEFFTSGRPFMLPLFWRFFLQDYGMVVIAQLVLSLISWILFSITLSWISPLPARIPVLVFTLITSLSWTIIFWDRVVMSESLAISLLVLTVTAGIATFKTANPVAYVTFTITACLWTLTRDMNTFVALAGAVPVAFLASRRLSYGLLGAAVIALAALAGIAMSQIGDRGQGPLFNVVTYRVIDGDAMKTSVLERGLPGEAFELRLVENKGMMTSLEKRGLPIDQLKLAISDGVYDLIRGHVVNDTRFDELRDWLASDGLGAYMRSLISNPSYTLFEPLPDLRKAVYPSVDHFAPVEANPIIGTESGWVPPPFALLAMIASGAVFIYGVSRMPRANARRYWLLLGSSALLALLHYYGVWLTDALALARHAIHFSVQVQLTWTILLVLGIRLIHQNRMPTNAE